MSPSDDDFFNYDFDNKDIELEDGFVTVGDDINLLEKNPSLHKVMIGLGWDLNTFESEDLDMDASLFLLDKNKKTRIDEDFIFYNNKMALDGSIKHHGDSRTGAGEGDDECISVDLHGVPFDILHIEIVISIYQGYEREQNMDKVRKAYIRLANEDNKHELLRFDLTPFMKDHTETAMVVGSLDREGPKWHFRPKADFLEKGFEEYCEAKGLVIIKQ